MSLATGVADDALRPAYQKLVTATDDVGEAQGALSLALDISKAGYGELESVSKALSSAYLGNTAALGRLKLPLDKNVIASGDMLRITEELAKVVGGQAAVAAGTYAGKMDRVSNAVSEAQEAIGYELLGALDSLSGAMGGTDGTVSMITEMGDATANVVAGVGVLAGEIETLSGAFEELGGPSGGLFDTIKWVEYLSPITAVATIALEKFGDAGKEARDAVARGDGLNDGIKLATKNMTDMAIAAGLIDPSASAAADALDEQGRAAARASTAVERLNTALDRLNGKNRGVVRSRMDLREGFANGPNATGQRTKADGTTESFVTRADAKRWALDQADTAEQVAQGIIDKGGRGSLARARRTLADARRGIGGVTSDYGIGDGFLSDILSTPALLGSPNSSREGTPNTRREVQSINYNFYGDLQVTSPQEAARQARTAARLAGLAGRQQQSSAAAYGGYNG